MQNIGQILINRRLITPDELDRALNVQRRHGGKLGNIIAELGFAKREHIDSAWANHRITPFLIAEIDRYCTNRFSAHPGHSITYQEVTKHDLLIEDMLNGTSLKEASITFKGTCTLKLGEAESIPVEFELDTNTNFAELINQGPAVARRWVDLVYRGIAKNANKSSEHDIKAA